MRPLTKIKLLAKSRMAHDMPFSEFKLQLITNIAVLTENDEADTLANWIVEGEAITDGGGDGEG